MSRSRALTDVSTAIIGRNYASDQGGGIHDDAAAQAHGYEGGLVPGVAIFAASLSNVVAHLGTDWAQQGRVQLKFSAPCYDGEPLTFQALSAEETPTAAHFECLHPDGRSSCSMLFGSNDEPTPDEAQYPLVEVAEPRLTGVESPEDRLLSLENMVSVPLQPSAEEIDGYLSGVGVEDDFRRLDVVNPAFLLRTYTQISRANFVTKIAGPTIHVESDVYYHRFVSLDEPLSLRGKVRHLFAKREHRYATFDYVWFAEDGSAVLRDVHTVVYQLRSHREQSTRANSST